MNPRRLAEILTTLGIARQWPTKIGELASNQWHVLYSQDITELLALIDELRRHESMKEAQEPIVCHGCGKIGAPMHGALCQPCGGNFFTPQPKEKADQDRLNSITLPSK